MNNLPLLIPKCPNHKVKVEYQKPHTPEQKWVGAGYKCPQCGFSWHLPSTELTAFLKEQKLKQQKLL